MRGLPFQGHEWFYCDGCANPTVGRCCGTLYPWNSNLHGNISDAIAAAHRQGHQFGYRPGYTCTQGRNYGDYNDFLGTLFLVDGIENGNPGEAMLGAAMGGGGLGDALVVGAIADAFDEDRDDDGGFFDDGDSDGW